jgi:hypothetical protein
MSEFKTSPVTQCCSRSGRGFLFWFLLAIFISDIGLTGWIFFRLTNRIESLEQQLQTAVTKNGGACV